MSDELRECPFCKCQDVMVRQASGYATDERLHYGSCLGCGAAGPLGTSRGQAEFRWNRRASGEQEATS